MKFIQKLLATVFAVLLMVTVITPNYFGLAKAEEVPVVTVYTNDTDDDGSPVYKTNSETNGLIASQTGKRDHYWSESLLDKVSVINVKKYGPGERSVYINEGNALRPKFTEAAVLRVVAQSENVDTVALLESATLSKDYEDLPLSELEALVVSLLQAYVDGENADKYALSSVEFASVNATAYTPADYAKLDNKTAIVGHYFGTGSLTNKAWTVGHTDTVKLTYTAEGLPAISGTASITIGEYVEVGKVTVETEGTGSGKVNVVDENGAAITATNGVYVVKGGHSFDVSATPNNNCVLDSLTVYRVTADGIVPVERDTASTVSVATGDEFVVVVEFTLVEVNGEDVDLSKRYEFAGKEKIEEMIVDTANAELTSGNINDYDVTSVQFESSRGIYKNVDEYSPLLGAHKFGADPITLKVTSSGNVTEDITNGFNNIVNGDIFNVPEEWVVGNSENVHITYTAKEGVAGPKTLTLNVVVTITEDEREPLEFTVSDVTVTYDEFDEDFVLDAVKENISVEENVDFKQFKLAEGQGHLNAGKHVVTVTFKATADDEFASNSKDVNVTVKKANGKVDAKSETFEYDGSEAKLLVKVEPEGSNEISESVVKVVVGVDGDTAGFASLIIPDSLKNQLSFDIFGMKIDVYEILTGAIRDGVKLGDLKGVITNIKDTISGLNFVNNPNLDMIVKALELVEKLPTVNLNATVYLDKSPTDVGAYAFVAVSTAPNYNISFDVASIIITPSTSLKLKWNQPLPENHTFSYSDMINNITENFDFGATLVKPTEEGDIKFEEKGDQEHVQILYAGLDTDLNPVLDLNSLEDVIAAGPGIYTETAVTIGGNYVAKPIVRTFIIDREKVTIIVDGEDENGNVTVTYNGKAQSVDVEAVCEGLGIGCDDEVTAALTERAIVIYSKDRRPVTNPVYAGEYSVLITVPGDLSHKSAQKRVTLVIEKDEVVLGSEKEEQHVTYNKEAQNYEYTVVCGNPVGEEGTTVCPEVAENVTVTYFDAEGNQLEGAPVNAGTYTAVVEFAGDANHKAAEPYTGTLVIDKKAVYVPFAANVRVQYDGKEHGFNFPEDVADALEITYTNSFGQEVSSPVNVGLYHGTAALKDTDNYEYGSIVVGEGETAHEEVSTARDIVVEIYRANTTVTFDVADAVYDGESHGATNVTVSDNCEEETLNPVVRYFGVNGTSYNSSKAPVNAGDYVVVAAYAGDWNHKGSSAMKKFTIAKAVVTVTLDDAAMVYGDETPELTKTVTVDCGVFDTDKLNVTPFVDTEDEVLCAGVYDISAAFDADPNVEVVVVNGKLAVTPKSVQIVIHDQKKVKGHADPELTWDLAEGSSMANGEDKSVLGVELDREAGESSGSYAIRFVSASNPNYFVTCVEEGEMVIIKPSAPRPDYVVPNTSAK